jgi:2-dehydro-3-deoxyphosphooctonate aldolase (KDO 8-P synthase)
MPAGLQKRIRVGAAGAGGCEIGGGAPLALIAGPCVIESEAHVLRMAELVARMAADAAIPLVFKASYDKANRSGAGSYRGPGMTAGLKILAAVKRRYRLPIVTDIHRVEEAAPAAEVADLLQIPAFLCRQTDLIAAAVSTGRPVNVKKGQFMSPWDMAGVLQKVEAAGGDAVILTERGASFGYNNLVVDMRSLAVLRGLNVPVIFDVTHSLQLPGAAGDRSGGMPQFIETLARAGVAAGVDGLFLEVHDAPEKALSDGANALLLERLPALLRQVKAVDAAVREVARESPSGA